MSLGQIYIFIHYSSSLLKIKKLCPNDREKHFKISISTSHFNKRGLKGALWFLLDSNPLGLNNQRILSPQRLPIPPFEQIIIL